MKEKQPIRDDTHVNQIVEQPRPEPIIEAIEGFTQEAAVFLEATHDGVDLKLRMGKPHGERVSKLTQLLNWYEVVLAGLENKNLSEINDDVLRSFLKAVVKLESYFNERSNRDGLHILGYYNDNQLKVITDRLSKSGWRIRDHLRSDRG